MRCFENILIRLTCKFVAEDDRGNKYYQSKQNNKLHQSKRCVIYKNDSDPSNMSSLWYMWLHYSLKEPPIDGETGYLWQESRQENATGTKNAYQAVNKRVSSDYKKWKPSG